MTFTFTFCNNSTCDVSKQAPLAGRSARAWRRKKAQRPFLYRPVLRYRPVISHETQRFTSYWYIIQSWLKIQFRIPKLFHCIVQIICWKWVRCNECYLLLFYRICASHEFNINVCIAVLFIMQLVLYTASANNNYEIWYKIYLGCRSCELSSQDYCNWLHESRITICYLQIRLASMMITAENAR